MDEMRRHRYAEDFESFFQLVAQGKYPLKCIALPCWLDTVKWYTCESTSQMTYRKDTQEYFRMVYSILHGKGINLMAGVKSLGQILNGNDQRGQIDPQLSQINFAIPDVSVLRLNSSDIPNRLEPGIIHQGIDIKSNSTSSMVIGFDGKKLAAGLNEHDGDINLWGYEKPNLKEANVRIEKETQLVDSTFKEGYRHEDLCPVISIVSNRIKQMRELSVRLHLHLASMKRKAGENWKQSKYAYGISRTEAHIEQCRKCTQELLSVSLILHANGAHRQGQAVLQKVDDIEKVLNYMQIPDMEQEEIVEPRLVKQRSDQWHSYRKNFPISGSTTHDALGFGGLKKMQQHIKNKQTGSEREVSPELQERFDHGAANEINAVATLCSIVLPFWYPELTFLEEGCYSLSCNGSPLMVVSPDGGLYKSDSIALLKQQLTPTEAGQIVLELPIACKAIEIKCPFPADFKTPVHYTLKSYHIIQVLAEMYAMNVEELLFCSWSNESMVVHRVTNDASLWNDVVSAGHMIYGDGKKPHVSKTPEYIKELQPRLTKFAESNVRLLCEVPSIIVGSGLCSQFEESILDNSDAICDRVKGVLKKSHELSRQQAREVIVWLLSDADRLWSAEVPHSIPIAYGMAGYGVSTATIRSMNDDTLSACAQKECHVACTVFDGAFFSLANRAADGSPLTVIQLAVTLYNSITKLTREEVLAILMNVVLDADVQNEEHAVSSKFLSWLFFESHKTDETNVDSNEVSDATTGLDNEVETAMESQLMGDPDHALDNLESEGTNEENNQQINDDSNEMNGASTVEPEVTGTENASMESEVTSAVDVQNSIGNEAGTHEDDENLESIITELRNHTKQKVSNLWKNKTIQDLRSVMSTAENLSKLTVPELDVIIKHTKDQQDKYQIKIKQSWLKGEKINALSKVLGDGSTYNGCKKKSVKEVLDLRNLAAAVLSKKVNFGRHVPKERLNTVCCKALFPHVMDEWQNDSTISPDISVIMNNNVSWKPEFWFSKLEYNKERKMLEPKTWDSHHLFVNCRSRVCSKGIPGFGIKKEAWHEVATKFPHIISKTIVVDLLDRQSNFYAQKTFSQAVEDALVQLGHHEEAIFCNLIRNWYRAEDEPGMPAAERVQHRIAFRNYLLSKANVDTFPPFGQSVLGMPRVMYEGFLQSIDTHIQLYGVVKGGAYNSRAVSTLNNETYFGEMTETEQTSLGCPKAINIPRQISKQTQILHSRHNPDNRYFFLTYFVLNGIYSILSNGSPSPIGFLLGSILLRFERHNYLRIQVMISFMKKK